MTHHQYAGQDSQQAILTTSNSASSSQQAILTTSNSASSSQQAILERVNTASEQTALFESTKYPVGERLS